MSIQKILSQSFWLMFLCVAQSAWAVETICNDNGGSGWPINDGSNTTIQITYNFGDVGYLTDIDFDVDITHTWMGDLTASITSPNGGTNVVLFERPGTAQGATVNGGPFGCPGNNLDVLFDDESANPPIENETCGNNPAYSGTHQPHNSSPNNLSAFDGENPTGVWDFNFFDPVDFDTGSMNEACLVVSAAAVVFDQWVSTNSSCTDTVDSASVLTGTDLYVCYIVENTGDEAFSLSAGDWTDSLGNDLSGLEGSYSASQTRSVFFGPFTAGNSPFFQGTTIATSEITVRGNTTNFPVSESLITDETINVYVSNATPGSAAKPLYLYNNDTLSRVIPASQQDENNIGELATRTWTMTPALESDLEINTSSVIALNLYLREVGTGSQRNITFTVSGSVSGTIATLTQNFNLTGTSQLYNVNLSYVVGAPTTLQDGETITLSISNNTSGSGNRRVRVIPNNPDGNYSRVLFPSNTIINVDKIGVYDVDYATDPLASPISYAQASDTLYIRAEISDPFGTFDITSINNQITDANSTVQASNIASMVVLDTGTSVKTYEFSYSIPPFPALGNWQIDITANEGAASEGITHSDFINFLVLAPPSLTVVKSSSISGNPVLTAAPGDTVTYNILVSNSGLGAASNIELEDVLGDFVTLDTGSFTCAAGCPASGVTLGTPSFTTVSGRVVSWNITMGGQLNAGESFELEYNATID